MELPEKIDATDLIGLVDLSIQTHPFDLPEKYYRNINGTDIEDTTRRRDNAKRTLDMLLAANSIVPQEFEFINAVAAWRLLNTDLPILQSMSDAYTLAHDAMESNELNDHIFGHHIEAIETALNTRGTVLNEHNEFVKRDGKNIKLNTRGLDRVANFEYFSKHMNILIINQILKGTFDLLSESNGMGDAWRMVGGVNRGNLDPLFEDDLNNPKSDMRKTLKQYIEKEHLGKITSVNLGRRYTGLGHALAARIFSTSHEDS